MHNGDRSAIDLRILLVEDDAGFAEFLRASLELTPGMQAKVASRLSSALATLVAERLDAIVLDLNLPDSKGLETLHQVSALAGDLPVVVLTGMDDSRQAQEALRLGAEDWLTKPFGDPEVLVRALRYAIERKRMTRKLVSLQKLEAVGRLARNVAHEFNNVLTAIIGNAELADLTNDPTVRTNALRELRHATMRGSLLTRQLLGVSRPRAASAPVADVGKVVTTLHNLLKAVLPRNVEMQVEPIEMMRAAIAPEQLEQVLLNLLLNARDAMSGQGKIVVSANRAASGSRVRVLVRDTGPGIRPDVLPQIFEPFFTTKGQSGSGLGLAISKELIEQSGGSIHAENAPTRGAVFIVELPEVSVPEPAPSSAPAS